MFEVFNQTHSETDFLLSYPDENSYDPQQEEAFLQKVADSTHEIELLAVVDERIVGLAGMHAVGRKYKVAHRAELGISILKDYWNLGIGRGLIAACIECAQSAGYTQLELTVVADNKRAVSLYRRTGFIEFGRNPKGYNSRFVGYQETVYMRLEL
nr:GNAT family N-acetyltransferase [uncultured Sphaerochaeta sp.]